jgi:hypothetical protein
MALITTLVANSLQLRQILNGKNKTGTAEAVPVCWV